MLLIRTLALARIFHKRLGTPRKLQNFVGRTQHEGWKDASWTGKERLPEPFGVMAAEKDRQTWPIASTLETSASHLASIWVKTRHLGSPNDPERPSRKLGRAVIFEPWNCPLLRLVVKNDKA